MRALVELCLIIVVVVSAAMVGAVAYRIGDDAGRSALADRLNECGYEPHPMSDVAWEMVRRGEIPVCTAAALSHMLRSSNAQSEIEICMEQIYPLPPCMGVR